MLRAVALVSLVLVTTGLAGAKHHHHPSPNTTSSNTTSPNTPSPNLAIAKPECNPNTTVLVRYSKGSKRLYVESSDGVTRGGCVTLTDIWSFMGKTSPLYPVQNVTGMASNTATGTWLLTETLWIKDGITLEVHGTSVGGDTDELRLLSTNQTYIHLLGYGGSLDFVSTKATSWNTYANGPDHDETDGRSYIRVVSEIVTDPTQRCDGRAKVNAGEARMDIEDSDMGYLGFHDGESYGLTWKVRGLCRDLSNLEVFDNINVYGNIYDSDIHHNHFGVYTYGHQQGDWRRNLMHHNTAYGFDPHDDSDFLTIHDNTVYSNGNHGIIASKRCNGVSIQGNEVYDGGAGSVGIFLHRSSDHAIVKDNYVHSNGDAGMALMETFNASVSGNVFADNKYGIRMSVGCADNLFANNNITDNTKYNIYTYTGSDQPWVVDSGRMKDNVIRDNIIVGAAESIKLGAADGTKFVDNAFVNALKVRFRASTWTVMSGNTGLDKVKLAVADGACFGYACDPGFLPKC